MLYEYVAQSSISDDIILEYPILLKSRAGFHVVTTYKSTHRIMGAQLVI